MRGKEQPAPVEISDESEQIFRSLSEGYLPPHLRAIRVVTREFTSVEMVADSASSGERAGGWVGRADEGGTIHWHQEISINL